MHQYPMTSRQKEALAAIIKLTEAAGGVSPSFQEVAHELGVSYGATIHRINGLTARGWLRRLPHTPRSLQVIEGPAA
jgi:hypothetical protein